MLKNLKPLLFLPFVFSMLTGCEGLEKTDKIRSEVLTEVKGKSLVYEMYLTGLDKYRYVYKLAGPQDTTQLFETSFTDASGNYASMELEQTRKGLKILLDRPIEKQSKTVEGVTFELEGTK
jgi:hypothetical protein